MNKSEAAESDILPESKETFMFDKLLDFIVNSVRSEERLKHEKEKELEEPTRVLRLNEFYAIRQAGELIQPAKAKAVHHREREKYYTTRLEEAEKELREKGVSVEAYNPSLGIYMPGNMQSVTSGAVSDPNTQFQPRIDQRLADNVKNAKSKMLEHRGAAEQAEKWARAFAQASHREIKLTVENIHYFRLEAK